MERIKQAIEKVKKQDSIAKKRHAELEQEKATASFNPNSSHDQIELEDFIYERTRKVNVQYSHLEKHRIVSFNKSNAMSMNFDLLRTLVLQKMKENNWRTLAITSPTPEAGKTVVAINLAMSIAQQTNYTALLADFDLRRPKIGTYFGIPMEKSLNEFLDGTAELSDVLVNPQMPKLVVLPTKIPVRKSSEILSSKKITDLIKDLRERYESRIVVFDLPPVLVSDDVIALMPQIDCVLMVVANGMSTKKEIEDSLSLLPSEKLIGTILNKADSESMGDYYY